MFVRGVRLAAAAAQAAQGPQGSRTAKRLEKTLEELGVSTHGPHHVRRWAMRMTGGVQGLSGSSREDRRKPRGQQ